MTSGIVNGTLIGLYVGGTKIANLVSNDLDLTMATRDTSNKDTVGWKTSLGGLMSWACSAEGMFDEAASYTFTQLFDVFIARKAVTVVTQSAVTGDHSYTGTALMTSLKLSAPNEANSTFTVQFEGTGQLTKATIV